MIRFVKLTNGKAVSTQLITGLEIKHTRGKTAHDEEQHNLSYFSGDHLIEAVAMPDELTAMEALDDFVTSQNTDFKDLIDAVDKLGDYIRGVYDETYTNMVGVGGPEAMGLSADELLPFELTNAGILLSKVVETIHALSYGETDQ